MDPSENPSLFPLQTIPPVSHEAFNIFHSIDRELYIFLIQNLNRDPYESIQVMAFWMWIERQITNESNFIKRLLTLPPPLVNELADEAMRCLKCAQNDQFLFSNPNPHAEITLLPDLLSNPMICLRFFHENRISVLRGVSKIIDKVCARALNDILQSSRGASSSGGSAGPGGGLPEETNVVEGSGGGEAPPPFMHFVQGSTHPSEIGGGGVAPPPLPPVIPVLYHPYLNLSFVPLPPPAEGGGLIPFPMPQVPPSPPQPEGCQPPVVGIPVHMGLPIYDFGVQNQMLLRGGIGEIQSNMNTDGGNSEVSSPPVVVSNEGRSAAEEEAPADDRTIFLTFSKGYPISEAEVRAFFNGRFGDFIEEVIMQEVPEGEQALYARMVARWPEVIDAIVGGNRAKYCINGKHVWARKYVRRDNPSRSPPRGGGW